MDMIEKVRDAIYNALCEKNWAAYVGGKQTAPGEMTVLDGDFDLAAVARAAIEAMREPSQNMIDAIDDSDVYSFWSTYQDAIDAALNPRTFPEAQSSE